MVEGGGSIRREERLRAETGPKIKKWGRGCPTLPRTSKLIQGGVTIRDRVGESKAPGETQAAPSAGKPEREQESKNTPENTLE